MKTSIFRNRYLPYLLATPQVVVVAVFFLWPTLRVAVDSLYLVGPFGLHAHFAAFANYTDALTSGRYANSLGVSAIYSALTTVISLAVGLLLAVLVQGVGRGRTVYRTLFAWTYAVPTSVVATLWLFMFEPLVGVASGLLHRVGLEWNFTINGFDAMTLIVMLTSWQQIAYNFLLFTAGLQSLPRAVTEAATLDGAGALRRFWRITFPLLSPTTFYLLVVDIIYSFFYTFAIVNIVTHGGPYDATNTMVYQIYQDAFQNSNTSTAAAETVLLILLVSALTVIQFRYLNRQVHYQ